MVYDILLDKNKKTSDSRSSPKAHALLMSFLQDKTDQKCNTSKIHSMAASFILLSFFAFLISLSQFFSCMCGHICSIFLFLILHFSLSSTHYFSFSSSSMYYFWPAAKEFLNFILTYIYSLHVLLEFLKFGNTERKKIMWLIWG